MTQAVSLHQMFQGDLTAIEAAFNQLVTANNAAKTYSNQLLGQLSDLQAQLATTGDPVTNDDLAGMNTLVAQIQQAAAATVTTGAAPSVPAAGAPAAGSDTSGSTDATAAPTSDSTAAAVPAAAAPVDAAPTTDPTVVPDTTSSVPGAYLSQPVTINASDSGTGTGASE